MFNEHGRVEGGVKAQNLLLRGIWHVQAIPGYDVKRGPQHWRRLLVLRTLSGDGRVALDDGTILVLQAGSLLLLQGMRLARYWCAGESWHFWWFECDSTEPPRLPLNSVLAVPAFGGEMELCQQTLNSLRREGSAWHNLAVAGMQLLLAQWESVWPGMTPRHPRQTEVERVLELMRDRLDGSLGMADMAGAAHLSEPQFRRVFKGVTGRAPKDYYDALRLERARMLMEQQGRTVGEVAADLGYSSPFHFSRAFKLHYGFAPSTCLGRRVGTEP